MKYLRVLAWSAFVVAGMWLALSAVIGMVAVENAFHPGRRPLRAEDEAAALSVADRNDATLKHVGISVADGAALRAWNIVPRRANGDAVILLHGQSDNRAGMLGNADLLLRHGYTVLLPDARAHGESGGAIATYGLLEADDVHRWVQWLQQTHNARCVDGLGDSMGGADLLGALPVAPEFCAVIAESTFASFRSASYERMGQFFHRGPWLGRTFLRPAIEAGFLYSRIRYGVDLSRNSPQDMVGASRTPVFLIHGLADTNLSPHNSEQISRANPRVQLWEPAAAGHCGAYEAAPEEYQHRVVAWFDQQVQR